MIINIIFNDYSSEHELASNPLYSSRYISLTLALNLFLSSINHETYENSEEPILSNSKELNIYTEVNVHEQQEPISDGIPTYESVDVFDNPSYYNI